MISRACSALKPAEWRVPGRALRLPVWLAGLALLFSAALLCSYQGEVADDAARLGARLGEGGQ